MNKLVVHKGGYGWLPGVSLNSSCEELVRQQFQLTFNIYRNARANENSHATQRSTHATAQYQQPVRFGAFVQRSNNLQTMPIYLFILTSYTDRNDSSIKATK